MDTPNIYKDGLTVMVLEGGIFVKSANNQEIYISSESLVEISKLAKSHQALIDALEGMLNKYVRLVDSGDAGNWDPETDAEVINGRSALSKARGQ